MSDQQIA
jgi:pimeloyl-ACP methyl ester carboxylesterase